MVIGQSSRDDAPSDGGLGRPFWVLGDWRREREPEQARARLDRRVLHRPAGGSGTGEPGCAGSRLSAHMVRTGARRPSAAVRVPHPPGGPILSQQRPLRRRGQQGQLGDLQQPHRGGGGLDGDRRGRLQWSGRRVLPQQRPLRRRGPERRRGHRCDIRQPRGGTLKCRLRVILFFFSHRITNVAGKSLNSRIQAIRLAARGFRNREHFKTAICLHCPGLDVYPVTHSIAGRARVIGVAEGRWSTPYTLRIRADSDGLLEMFRHSSLATSGSPSRRACQRCGDRRHLVVIKRNDLAPDRVARAELVAKERTALNTRQRP
jgi:hypothetical protein